MKVWNNSWYSGELKEQVIYTGELFVHKITEYFKSRSYGNGVQEIFYIEVCEKPIFKNTFGKILNFNPEIKRIEVGLDLSYDIAVHLNNKQFSRYLANKYIERSSDIIELAVNDFRLDEYIHDLEAFFKMNLDV